MLQLVTIQVLKVGAPTNGVVNGICDKSEQPVHSFLTQ